MLRAKTLPHHPARMTAKPRRMKRIRQWERKLSTNGGRCSKTQRPRSNPGTSSKRTSSVLTSTSSPWSEDSSRTGMSTSSLNRSRMIPPSWKSCLSGVSLPAPSTKSSGSSTLTGWWKEQTPKQKKMPSHCWSKKLETFFIELAHTTWRKKLIFTWPGPPSKNCKATLNALWLSSKRLKKNIPIWCRSCVDTSTLNVAGVTSMPFTHCTKTTSRTPNLITGPTGASSTLASCVSNATMNKPRYKFSKMPC